jgi:hypothetical protein
LASDDGVVKDLNARPQHRAAADESTWVQHAIVAHDGSRLDHRVGVDRASVPDRGIGAYDRVCADCASLPDASVGQRSRARISNIHRG